jgi:hypothetical protein
MSHAVVCRTINGYEDYERLPEAALTSDEKLLVYYRPLGYKSVLSDGSYQSHFTQDGLIRRRGAKAALRTKRKLLDYTAKGSEPPTLIFLRNTISLKGLKPGDYEFLIILRDEIAKGPPVTQVVAFRIIPASLPGAKDPAAEATSKPPGRDSR